MADPHQAVAVPFGEHHKQGILQCQHGIDIAVKGGKVSIRIPIAVAQPQRQGTGQKDQFPKQQAALLAQLCENQPFHSPPSSFRKS